MRMPGASALALALVLILALVAVVSMIRPARAEDQYLESRDHDAEVRLIQLAIVFRCQDGCVKILRVS